MEDYSRTIGGNIRYERQRRNLTIEELSDCIGIAPGFLGLIERGQRGTSIKNLCNIASFFDLTLDQLIRESLGQVKTADKEKTAKQVKQETASTLLTSFDADELDLVIGIMKRIQKYNKSKLLSETSED